MSDANETNGHVDPGVSIRFGAVQKKTEVDMADADSAGASKRKSRTSVGQKSYAEPESSEEDQPLVRHFPSFRFPILLCDTITVAVSFGG